MGVLTDALVEALGQAEDTIRDMNQQESASTQGFNGRPKTLDIK